MKKTYTACFILGLFSLLYYGEVIGGTSQTCPRPRGETALASNPGTCNTSGCHIGGVVVDSSAGPTTNPSGISSVAFTQGIAAYPTLAADYVTIATTEDARDLQYNIYGLDGRQVMAGTLPSYPTLTSVDVHSLAPASYVIRVNDEAHSATFRIIKQ